MCVCNTCHKCILRTTKKWSFFATILPLTLTSSSSSPPLHTLRRHCNLSYLFSPFRISSKAKNDVRFLFVHPVAHAPRFPNTNNNKRNVRPELVAVHHASCGWHSSSFAFIFFSHSSVGFMQSHHHSISPSLTHFSLKKIILFRVAN